MEGGDISTDQVSELLSNMVAKLKVLKRKVGFLLTILVVVLILLTLWTDEIVPVVEITLAPISFFALSSVCLVSGEVIGLLFCTGGMTKTRGQFTFDESSVRNRAHY